MSGTVFDLDLEEIKARVENTINSLAFKDGSLFSPLEGEHTIANKFAYWLQGEFTDWNVDTEYRHIMDGTSETAREKVAFLWMRRYRGRIIYHDEPEERKVIPDIIIHHRGTTDNLMAIEIKKSNNRKEIEFDYEKLRAYREFEPLRYRYALFVRFQKLEEDGQIVAEINYLRD